MLTPLRKLARAHMFFMTLALLLATPTSLVLAQDDEEEEEEDEGDEEGGGDLDSLMASDPEREESDDEGSEDPFAEVEGEGGQDSGGEGEGLGGYEDDERPPGDRLAPEKKAGDDEKKDEPEEESVGTRVGIGLLVGYGLRFEDAANPWAFGLGGQATLDFGLIALSGRLAFHLGETVTMQQAAFQGNGGTFQESSNLWELGVEGGIDIDIKELTLRPGIGLGFAVVSRGDATDARGYVAPGLALLYNVGESFYLGLDTRYKNVFGVTTLTGLTFMGVVGMQF